MYPGKETVITRLRREMKESPLPAPMPQKPTYRLLADGYERQTLEEPMQMTEKYRHRTRRLIVRWICIATVIACFAVAVIKAGIIRV